MKRMLVNATQEEELRLALGMKVKLTHNSGGRGKLTVHFRNHEEFERILRTEQIDFFGSKGANRVEDSLLGFAIG